MKQELRDYVKKFLDVRLNIYKSWNKEYDFRGSTLFMDMYKVLLLQSIFEMCVLIIRILLSNEEERKNE